MKKLRMAFVEGCKSGKLPGRPEMKVIERVVPPVNKRNSSIYFLKSSSDKPNA